MISFHAYWLPIVITVLCVGLPLGALLSREQYPFQSVAAAAFLVMGSLVSIIAWLVYFLSAR